MIAIVTPTYSRNEGYCDTVAELAGQLWPAHPDIWFLTDRGNIRHRDTIVTGAGDWLDVLCRGLNELQRRQPGVDYVYLILEDLYPLWPCSTQDLNQIEEIAVRRRLNHVAFVPYFWGGAASELIDGRVFHVVPRDFGYYCQLQPALWRLEHLMAVCRQGADAGVRDPWAFESLKTGEAHYVSDYGWPTVLNGFLTQGGVNRQALRRIRLPAGARLMRQLLWNSLCEFPANGRDALKKFVRRFQRT